MENDPGFGYIIYLIVDLSLPIAALGYTEIMTEMTGKSREKWQHKIIRAVAFGSGQKDLNRSASTYKQKGSVIFPEGLYALFIYSIGPMPP